MKHKGETRIKPHRSRAERRVFLCSLGVTLCVLILLFGLIAVDYQGRRLSFGDTELPLEKAVTADGKTQLTVRAFGLQGSFDITELEKFWNFFLDFSCIPHR